MSEHETRDAGNEDERRMSNLDSSDRENVSNILKNAVGNFQPARLAQRIIRTQHFAELPSRTHSRMPMIPRRSQRAMLHLPPIQ
jgi:hypothetical protein